MKQKNRKAVCNAYGLAAQNGKGKGEETVNRKQEERDWPSIQLIIFYDGKERKEYETQYILEETKSTE